MESSGQTTLSLNFCKEEEIFCIDIDFSLECEGCDNNRIEGRRNLSSKDLLRYIVYPNPTNDELTIKEPANKSKVKHYKIYDINGNLIYEEEFIKEKNKISLAKLSSGLFFLELFSDSSSEFHKIIKLN